MVLRGLVSFHRMVEADSLLSLGLSYARTSRNHCVEVTDLESKVPGASGSRASFSTDPISALRVLLTSRSHVHPAFIDHPNILLVSMFFCGTSTLSQVCSPSDDVSLPRVIIRSFNSWPSQMSKFSHPRFCIPYHTTVGILWCSFVSRSRGRSLIKPATLSAVTLHAGACREFEHISLMLLSRPHSPRTLE